jgi:hypothetical protein
MAGGILHMNESPQHENQCFIICWTSDGSNDMIGLGHFPMSKNPSEFSKTSAASLLEKIRRIGSSIAGD